ncbi:hypothetical protein ANCDUO_05907 [Ancylostoma duodenale]|uniref:Uncharacterized protein n=1 Tax=Ancylostoma duodenale TaxID=51022 RepID=A0A0C2DMD9_9BILA|nr:hypothetical protein ANCDUO_05907 [Ancylostoma duodenale]
MLRWPSGVAQFDRICTQDIRQRYGVVAIADKVREARLRWFGVRSRPDLKLTKRTTGQCGVKVSAKRTPLRNGKNAEEEV